MAFGDVNAPVKGIDQFKHDEVPPLWMTFVSFHNMVLLGSLFILLMAWAAWSWRGNTLWTARRFLFVLMIALPLPIAACQFGWVTVEVGRQPWFVQGLLKTRDAVSGDSQSTKAKCARTAYQPAVVTWVVKSRYTMRTAG